MIVIQRCPICKSTDIQEKAWINVNTGKVEDRIDDESVWCPECELQVEPQSFTINNK